jgi:hypothetical protein
MSTSGPTERQRLPPRVRPQEVPARLEQFAGRGAGTDAERRAAEWLARELLRRGRTRSERSDVSIETFWCRPNWALAQAWHVVLALAGSLVSVPAPRAGGSMLLAALVFVLADALTGISPGRWLTRQRASQNVVASPIAPDPDRLQLIITANYDAGRSALVYRDPLRARAARARQRLSGFTPGWQGWLVIAILWLLASAILRVQGHQSTGIGAIQLPPTLALLVALALLVDLGTARWSPAAGDNGSGVAVAVALARALATSPPVNLNVELVLTGAGDGEGAGLREYLRERRRTHCPTNTVVLGIGPCVAGRVRWWRSDGSLFPLRYARRLTALARRVAGEQPELGGRPHDGRGATSALSARRARIPALTLGCLDGGLVPRSHQAGDVAGGLDPAAPDQTVHFGLMLVDAIDAALSQRATGGRRPGRHRLRQA